MGTAPLSGSRPCTESPRVAHERVRSAEEDHGSSHEPEDRGPRAVVTNGKNEQHHAGEDAEGRDQSADAVGHMDIINDNLGQRKRSKRTGLAAGSAPRTGRLGSGRRADGGRGLCDGRLGGLGCGVVGGAQPAQAGRVGEGQDGQCPAGRCHQQVRRGPLGGVAVLALPPGSGDEAVAHGAQCGFRRVQNAVGDRVDLCRSAGGGEGLKVRVRVGGGPRGVGQGVRGEKGFCVASRPPLQIVAGGEVVPGGVDLLGATADVVIQLEVRVVRENAAVLRIGAGYRSWGPTGSGKPSRMFCRVVSYARSSPTV